MHAEEISVSPYTHMGSIYLNFVCHDETFVFMGLDLRVRLDFDRDHEHKPI